jgi:uncharacterized membrane protein YkvA (DUF1232 family)
MAAMPRLAEIGIIVLALWAASWLVFALLARRLPPGLLRDMTEFVPACVTTARRLRGHPQVPRRARVALLAAVLWVLSPIDLIPDFIPVLGWVDDIVIVPLAIRWLLNRLPAHLRADLEGR